MTVPLPNLNRRFDLRRDDHRRYLTGGLDTPTVEVDGAIWCPYCSTNVPALLVDTHVQGAWPARIANRHACRKRAA